MFSLERGGIPLEIFASLSRDTAKSLGRGIPAAVSVRLHPDEASDPNNEKTSSVVT